MTRAEAADKLTQAEELIEEVLDCPVIMRMETFHELTNVQAELRDIREVFERGHQ